MLGQFRFSSHRLRLLSLALILLGTVSFFPCTLGALTNRTIEDSGSHSPLYQPTDGVWHGPSCADCKINPDTIKASSGSWQDATNNGGMGVNMTLEFTGAFLVDFLNPYPDGSYAI
jgi:hypothetical protein